MIFVAVGTQLPFDRLIKAIDSWCAERGRGDEVFGQIGQVGPENYKPEHFDWAERIGPDDFVEKIKLADVIVGHAGMGSIITAMSYGKPIVVLPRRAHLEEHRNDHQLATVKRLGSRPGLFSILDEAELPDILDQLVSGNVTSGQGIPPFAEEKLIGTLHDFIHGSAQTR